MKNDIENSRVNMAVNNIATDLMSKIKIPIPTFFNDLGKYQEVKKIPENERSTPLSQTLEDGMASWYVLADDVSNYDQFKTSFKNRFWNTSILRQTRRKL